MKMKNLRGFLFFLTLFPLTTFGHQGLYEAKDATGFEDAIVLPKPDISYAVYMRLSNSADIDFISFQVDGPMEVKVSLLVPQRPEFLDYYPAFSIVGPGLPAPQEELTFSLPAGLGAVVMRSDPSAEREKFYEPFSMTRYYRGFAVFDQEISTTGTYYIVIWDPEGESGDYVVTYGEKESFTPREMLSTFRVVGKVWNGEWGRYRGHAPTRK
jgi:hypothetical protein